MDSLHFGIHPLREGATGCSHSTMSIPYAHSSLDFAKPYSATHFRNGIPECGQTTVQYRRWPVPKWIDGSLRGAQITDASPKSEVDIETLELEAIGLTGSLLVMIVKSAGVVEIRRLREISIETILAPLQVVRILA